MFLWGSLASQFTPTRLEFRIHNVSQAAPKGSRQSAVVPATNPLRSIGFPSKGCSPCNLEGCQPSLFFVIRCVPNVCSILHLRNPKNLLLTNEPCSLDSCVRRPDSRHLRRLFLREVQSEHLSSDRQNCRTLKRYGCDRCCCIHYPK